ncbi:extracellular solute-binding protein [Paenibacillus sp. LMG 31460]|uniref:Extracellular solute-binding protein n=1 Tax=Paenibacillus germinis TaxID=2654979 RepID=A0ABX1ZA18_9BACL|nr:extracellular solute-binding protein [Paenibacillus germinis]NOU88756.1 extracellular solute-binding protein [Paenibacillus germinis]
MKKFITLGLTILLSSSIVGCSKSSNSTDATKAPVATTAATTAATPAPEKPAELNVLVFESPNLTAQYWDAAIKRFTDKHPNIKVNKIVSPDVDRTKYAKQLLATGQFPDVLMSVNLQDFIGSKSLMPFEAQDIAKFPGAMGTAIDGKVYQLPMGAQVISYIYYNKKMFETAGATEPKTWKEFVDVVEKLKKTNVTPLLYGGAKDPWSTTFMLDGIISADVFGKTPDWVSKRKKGEVKFSDPLFKNAVLKWKSLYDAKAFNTDGLSIGYAQLQEAFLKGKGAMYPMGSWFTSAADAQKDINVGVFPIPTEDGSTFIPYNVGGAASVSATTKFPKEAQMFAVEYSSDPENVGNLVKGDGLIPLEGVKVNVELSPLFKQVVELSGKGKKVNTFGWETGDSSMIAGMTDEINKSAQNIILGKSVDEELAALDKKWDEISSRMPK